VLGEDRGEVEEGAGGGGDRDPVVGGDLVRGEARDVGLDAGPRAAVCGGDLNVAAVGVAQAPKRAGVSVAEPGPGSAGEDGRHPVRVSAERAVADGVDAAVQDMQATGQYAASMASKESPRARS
jgi:hypothetical protein